MMRSIDSLTPEDFAKSPVWRFTDSNSSDVTNLRPVKQLPTRRLAGCIVGVPVHLANGTVLTGIIGNFDTISSRLNEHFPTISVFRSDGFIFHMARYHDFDAAERGVSALAAFLGLSLEAVFPITYDLCGIVVGSPEILRGTINAQPRERLTRAEVIALAVP